MLRFRFHFLDRILRSRLGLLLTSAHLCLVIYSFSLKEPWHRECHDQITFAGASFIAGRNLHWHYETVLLKVIIILDLPGAVLALPIEFLLRLCSPFLPQMCSTTESWRLAAMMLATTSLQWLCIGYWIERWWITGRSGHQDMN